MRGKRKKRSNKTFFFLLHLQSSLLCHLFIYYLPQDLEELKSYDPWGKGFGTRKVGNERKERERDCADYSKKKRKSSHRETLVDASDGIGAPRHSRVFA